MKISFVTSVAVAAALLIGGIWITSRRQPVPVNIASKAGMEDETKTVSSRTPSQASVAASPSVTAPAPIRLEGTGAAGDLSVRDRLDRIRQFLREGEIEEADRATSDLQQQAVDQPGAFSELLAFFQSETDSDLLLRLARILGPRLETSDEKVKQEVLGMASKDPLPARRAAALALVASLKSLPPDAIETVAELSRADESDDVRLNAVYTLGHWADLPDHWDAVSRALVQTIDANDAPHIRGNAIQTIALRGDRISDDVLAAMTDFLENDPTPKNRAIAALAFGDVPESLQPIALKHLQQAFNRETDLSVRRNMMTQIARTGDDAIPFLLELKTDHPLLRQDVLDYIRLIESGEVNSDNIYEHKFALDAERDTIVGAAGHSDTTH